MYDLRFPASMFWMAMSPEYPPLSITSIWCKRLKAFGRRLMLEASVTPASGKGWDNVIIQERTGHLCWSLWHQPDLHSVWWRRWRSRTLHQLTWFQEIFQEIFQDHSSIFQWNFPSNFKTHAPPPFWAKPGGSKSIGQSVTMWFPNCFN